MRSTICFFNMMKIMGKRYLMIPAGLSFGKSIISTDFYVHLESFDKECEITNKKFHKNQNASDIKSHHYIISYDPTDVTECGLTGEKAQALSLALAKKIFPGYQALIVTHTDGHNKSGNIHTHIVINSVRKMYC